MFFRGLLALFLVGLVVEVLLIAPEDLANFSEKELATQGSDDAEADQIMSDVHLVETADGKREWELWADRALGFKGRGTWNVEKVRVVFFSEKGIEFRVTGNRGTVSVDSKDMLIEGNVITKTSNDYIFLTDSMVYSSSLRELKTAHPVKIDGPRDKKGHRMKLKGTGMLAEMKSGDIYIHRNVRGVRALSADRALYIRSNEAHLTGLSNVAIFKGQVVMELDTQTITGPKATLRSENNQSELRSIEFVGGVRVSDESKWGTSDRLNIFVPQKKLVLEGSPRVVQNNDEIRGEVIVFLNGGKQVQVLSGQAQLQDRVEKKQREKEKEKSVQEENEL